MADLDGLIESAMSGSVTMAEWDALAPHEYRQVLFNAVQRLDVGSVGAFIAYLETLLTDIQEIQQWGAERLYERLNSSLPTADTPRELDRLRKLAGIETAQDMEKLLDGIVREAERFDTPPRIIAGERVEELFTRVLNRSELNLQVATDVLRTWLLQRSGDRPAVAAWVAVERNLHTLAPAIQTALDRLAGGKLSAENPDVLRASLEEALRQLNAQPPER
jgi:hypothetical protein